MHRLSAQGLRPLRDDLADDSLHGTPAHEDGRACAHQPDQRKPGAPHRGAPARRRGSVAVEVVVPDGTLRQGVDTAWLILGALGIALIAIAGMAADRMARSVVAPTRALAGAAHKVGQGRIETRVDPYGPHELVEVGRAFNLLAGRIGELLGAEREAAADLSHRLRTPLTALRLDIERLERESTAIDCRTISRISSGWWTPSFANFAGRAATPWEPLPTSPMWCATESRSGRRWPKSKAALTGLISGRSARSSTFRPRPGGRPRCRHRQRVRLYTRAHGIRRETAFGCGQTGALDRGGRGSRTGSRRWSARGQRPIDRPGARHRPAGRSSFRRISRARARRPWRSACGS